MEADGPVANRIVAVFALRRVRWMTAGEEIAKWTHPSIRSLGRTSTPKPRRFTPQELESGSNRAARPLTRDECTKDIQSICELERERDREKGANLLER